MSFVKKFLRAVADKLPASYIVMFHHVEGDPLIKKSGCVLDSCKFVEFTDKYAAYCASLNDVVKRRKKNKIAITFDDGLEDVFAVAYPILKQKQIPFSVFVVTDFLDTPGYITKEQLRILSEDALVTIGSHGMTHEVFPKLNSLEKEKELCFSKNKLEEMIGKKVDFFAYSHGQYDKESLKLVRCYRYALSVKERPLILPTRKRYLLPRYNVDNNTYEKIKNFLDKKLNKKGETKNEAV